MSTDLCVEVRSCSQCERSVDSIRGRLPVDAGHFICDDCYRKLLIPDHRPVMMELFD